MDYIKIIDKLDYIKIKNISSHHEDNQRQNTLWIIFVTHIINKGLITQIYLSYRAVREKQESRKGREKIREINRIFTKTIKDSSMNGSTFLIMRKSN